MIPCLRPKKLDNSKSAFEKKNLENRQKTMARFLRGILRSPDLRSHPLVLEFFKVDHFKEGGWSKLKEFSQALEKEKLDLNKSKAQISNGYRISSNATRIPIQPEFIVQNLDPKSFKGELFDQQKFDENYYVDKYDKTINKILSEIKKYGK